MCENLEFCTVPRKAGLMGTLTEQIAEFLKRGQQAQKAVDDIIRRAESRPDKTVAVSHWPAPKWSSPRC
jgi:hypothetical protein